jgi:hypothetical protein
MPHLSVTIRRAAPSFSLTRHGQPSTPRTPVGLRLVLSSQLLEPTWNSEGAFVSGGSNTPARTQAPTMDDAGIEIAARPHMKTCFGLLLVRGAHAFVCFEKRLDLAFAPHSSL